MRALALTLVLLALASGCSRVVPPAPADPGIEARTAIAAEDRSTCEALSRVDLALVGRDEASLERSSRALQDVTDRAPEDLATSARSLASTFAGAASTPGSAGDLQRNPDWLLVVSWFNTRCGGVR